MCYPDNFIFHGPDQPYHLIVLMKLKIWCYIQYKLRPTYHLGCILLCSTASYHVWMQLKSELTCLKIKACCKRLWKAVLRNRITQPWQNSVYRAEMQTALKLNHAVDAGACTVKLCSRKKLQIKGGVLCKKVVENGRKQFKWLYFPIKWGCV